MAPPAKRQKLAKPSSAQGTRDISSFFSPQKSEKTSTSEGSTSRVAPSDGSQRERLELAGTPCPCSPPASESISFEPDSDERTEEELYSQGLSSDAILALKLHAAETGLSLGAACSALGVNSHTCHSPSSQTLKAQAKAKTSPLIDISQETGLGDDVAFEDVFLEKNPDESLRKGPISLPTSLSATPESAQKKEARCLRPTGGHEHSSSTSSSSASTSVSPNKPSAIRPRQNQVDPVALDQAVETIPLEKDILLFDPYRDVDTSLWPVYDRASSRTPDPSAKTKAKSAPFAFLTRAFVILSGTRSRLKIVTVLTNTLRVLRAHDPESLLPAVYLVSNHIAPSYQGVELGLGGRTLSRVVANVTSASPALMKQLWDRTGDPGDVAFEARKARGTRSISFFGAASSPAPLLIKGVYESLLQIATSSGPGSASRKADVATRLLRSCGEEEIRFMARILSQNIRIQVVKTTITVALARTFALVDRPASIAGTDRMEAEPKSTQDDLFLIFPEQRRGLRIVPLSPAEAKAQKDAKVNATTDGPLTALDAASVWGSEQAASEQLSTLKSKLLRAEKLVRRTFAQHPNFSDLVPALCSVNLSSLAEAVPLQVGTPIMPMLGSITRSLDDMFSRMRLGEPLQPPNAAEQGIGEDGDLKSRLSSLRAFVSEFKYDGQRVQIHCTFVPFRQPQPVENGGNEAAAAPKSEKRLNQADQSFEDRKRAAALKGLVDGERGSWVSVPGQGEMWVRLFSRHLEDMTSKYPDITHMLPYLMGWQSENQYLDEISRGGSYAASTPRENRVQSLILDAEIVAVSPSRSESNIRDFTSPADLEILPFQVLSNRSRKNVVLDDVRVNVAVFAFDLMLLDDQVRVNSESFIEDAETLGARTDLFLIRVQSLLQAPFRRRRELLHTCLPALEVKSEPRLARFAHVQSQVFEDEGKISEAERHQSVRAFFDRSRQSQCEGIMVKTLDNLWETPFLDASSRASDRREIASTAAPSGGSKFTTKPLKEDDLRHRDFLLLSSDFEEQAEEEQFYPGNLPPVQTRRGKALLSTYEPDRRAESWLKVKKDYVEGVGDSLDLVPIGAWHGTYISPP